VEEFVYGLNPHPLKKWIMSGIVEELGTTASSIVFLPIIEILTKIINHTNKETVYNPLTGKKPVIFARWVSLNIWLRLFNTPP
jgi:hypothetical protein